MDSFMPKSAKETILNESATRHSNAQNVIKLYKNRIFHQNIYTTPVSLAILKEIIHGGEDDGND
jgi:polyhydroxyalkanoate synthesis regulator protein